MMKCSLSCIFVFVLTSGLCGAAHFEAVHEMTFCNSDAIVQSNIGGPYEDPQSNWTGDFNWVNSYRYIEYVGSASGYSDIDVGMDPFPGSYNEYPLPAINLSAQSHSYVYLTEYSGTEGILADGWANAHTVAIGHATGNFYRILPDGDEAIGDLVTITISYDATVGIEGNHTDTVYDASVSGGFSGDDLLITLNCQDYDEPQESEILHRFDKLVLGENEWLTSEDEVPYQVKIGDIIGIHVAAGSHVKRTTIDDEQLHAYATLNLGVVINSYDGPAPFDPRKADLNNDGKVNLADLALFASAWLWEEGM